METNIATGITLASFTNGKQVSTAVSFVLQGNNGGWTTIASDQYDVARANGRVFKRLYDDSDAAVDWTGYTSYRATYALYDPTTQSTTTYTNEAQTYGEFDFFPGVFDPSSGKLNATLLDGLVVTATQFADSIGSDNFSSGVSGWQITRAGDAEFNDIVARGTIYASAGEITGVLTIGASGGIFQGTGTFGSPTTALKIYNDSGIGVWELWGGGTKQVYANTSGQLVASAGAITLDADGITVDADGTNYVQWKSGSTLVGAISSTLFGGITGATVISAVGSSVGQIELQTSGNSGASALEYKIASTTSGSYVLVYPGSGSFSGFGIGASSFVPASLLHLKSTAPTFRMEDSTASAKSLLLTVDANMAQFEEAGGAANDLFVLDLANARVGIGTASPTATFNVEGATVFNDSGADVDFRIEGDTEANLFFVDASTNRIGIGTGSPGALLDIYGDESPKISVNAANGGLNVWQVSASSSGNGGTVGVGTNDGAAMASLDRLGQFVFMGHDGSNTRQGPLLIAYTTEAWSGTARGSAFYFYTIPNTTTTQTLALLLGQDQSALFKNSVKSDSATAGIGYGTGAGGTVTQATSKATGVTLNKVVGTITMNNAALAADTTVTFTLTNSAIAATDFLILNHTSAGTAGAYTLNAQVAAGSATINVRNVTAGSLSEAIVIRFAVIKGVTS